MSLFHQHQCSRCKSYKKAKKKLSSNDASAMLLRHCIISLSTQSAGQVYVWCRNCKAAAIAAATAAKPGQQNPLSAASGQPQVPTAMHGPDPRIFCRAIVPDFHQDEHREEE